MALSKKTFGLDPAPKMMTMSATSSAPKPKPMPTLTAAPPSPTTKSPLATTSVGLDPDTTMAATSTLSDPNPVAVSGSVGTQAGSVWQGVEAAEGTYQSAIDTGYEEKEQDVAEIASGYMSQDSALMQQAAADGLQAANESGLMNSSIAVTASQDAALQHIVPMASQTASQNYGMNLSYQEAQQASALSSQDTVEGAMLAEQGYKQQLGIGEQEYEHASALSEQDYEQTSALSEQDYEQTSALSEHEFSQTSSLSQQEYEQQLGLAQQQYIFDTELMQLDYEQEAALMEQGFNYEQMLQESEQAFQESVASMELSQAQHAQAQDAVNEVWNNYQEQYYSIMANPDLSNKQREEQLAQAEALAKSQIKTIDATYGTDFNTTLKYY